jgi:hypothetical protein
VNYGKYTSTKSIAKSTGKSSKYLRDDKDTPGNKPSLEPTKRTKK